MPREAVAWWTGCFPSPAANSCPHFGAVKPLGSVLGPAGEPPQHSCPPKPHQPPQLSSCSAHGLALSFHPQPLLPLSRNKCPRQAALCFCNLLLCTIPVQTALAYLMWPLTTSETHSPGFYYCSYNVYSTLWLFPLVEAFPHILKEALFHLSVLLISPLQQMLAGEAFLCFQASATSVSCVVSGWTRRGYHC